MKCLKCNKNVNRRIDVFNKAFAYCCDIHYDLHYMIASIFIKDELNYSDEYEIYYNPSDEHTCIYDIDAGKCILKTNGYDLLLLDMMDRQKLWEKLKKLSMLT